MTSATCQEIERAENIAAGLPPEGAPAEPQRQPAAGQTRFPRAEPGNARRRCRRKRPFEPVPIPGTAARASSKAIKAAATNLVKKVQRLIKPVKKAHKEVIINAESLETRVAVLGRRQARGIQHRTHHRGTPRRQHLQRQSAQPRRRPEGRVRGHRFREECLPALLGHCAEQLRQRRGNRRARRPAGATSRKITQKDIPRVYPPGSEIIVQVTKGPIGTKGPRVTTNLVLPGRYLVLLPNSDQSGISRKIENQQERQRLKKILRELTIPEGMGVIMRTVGEGQQKRYFVRDLALLLEEWNQIQDRIKSQPPATCVFQEPDLIERTVRDFLTEDVERIVVDSHKAYDRMREMISKISKRSADKVKLYTDSQPIFDRFNITRQLENAFSRQVHLKSGGYIVIDETEALVAIDVNTGRHKGGKDQESTILKVNLEAAEEISRQLRLRNMGGLIVLDFIDMKSRRDQQQVYQRMKDGLRRDKAKTHILPISQLGLMEMTRQRHSESVRAAVYDDCPYCKGRGKVKSALTMSVEIQRKLSEILKKRSRDESDFQLRIVVHPTVLERLRTEDEKHIHRDGETLLRQALFRADPAMHAEQFKIVNVATNEELASVGG